MIDFIIPQHRYPFLNTFVRLFLLSLYKLRQFAF